MFLWLNNKPIIYVQKILGFCFYYSGFIIPLQVSILNNIGNKTYWEIKNKVFWSFDTVPTELLTTVRSNYFDGQTQNALLYMPFGRNSFFAEEQLSQFFKTK